MKTFDRIFLTGLFLILAGGCIGLAIVGFVVGLSCMTRAC